MNSYDPVFPSSLAYDENTQRILHSGEVGFWGMSTRDFIALKFACAAITNANTTNPWRDEFVAVESYKLADMFIEVSNRAQENT